MASPKPVTLYGIKNCDTMKKARAWLDAKGLAYAFHDYKTQGVDASRLRRWTDEVGWEVLLNRNGTTFRGLPDEQKAGLTAQKAVALMLERYEVCRGLFHGFDRSRWTAGTPRERLALLPAAQEHILRQENGKDDEDRGTSRAGSRRLPNGP